MSALIQNINQYSHGYFPLIFLLLGLTSSLHCIGMCGGLAAASSPNGRSSWFYQIGRLTGYLSLSFILFQFSKNTIQKILPNFSLYSWYFIFAFIILWGLSVFLKGKYNSIKLPKKFTTLVTYLNIKAFKIKKPRLRAAIIGFLSIFLPCGVLYLAIFSLLATTNIYLTFISISFFWMGTLPVMHFGIHFIRRFITKINTKIPYMNKGLMFIALLLLLVYRFPKKDFFPQIYNNPSEVTCH